MAISWDPFPARAPRVPPRGARWGDRRRDRVEMFSGSHDHVLDEKGRTSLPKEFRLLLAESDGDPWITALRECLAVFPAEVWTEFKQRLSAASIAAEPVQQAQRLFTGMAVRCPFDRQGRILIPPKLRSWAHLERDVVLMGVGNRIEVWDRIRHDREMEAIRSHYAEITQPLREYGL